MYIHTEPLLKSFRIKNETNKKHKEPVIKLLSKIEKILNWSKVKIENLFLGYAFSVQIISILLKYYIFMRNAKNANKIRILKLRNPNI